MLYPNLNLILSIALNERETMVEIETVEIIREVNNQIGGSWQPIEGKATRSLREQICPSRVPKTEWETIKEEAISVLAKCVAPTAPPKQETGLVVGHVQSGKTLSFTTVAALARDNGYQMVIAIAGTSINLRDQSTKRLEDDLNLLTRADRKWQHFKSHEFNEGDHAKIANVLADWQDPSVPDWERQTVLITTMKHHQHLKNLGEILSRIDHLSNVPTLIIDDEADQASLNIKVQKGEASTTYQRVLTLREYLPHHTFLQYTATPQAPLLINLIDVLSPNFAKVLTPGAKYIGGKAFFHDQPNRIYTIPDSEIPTRDAPLDAPPESLLEAMRIFFLGVTAAMILEGEHLEGNRSMMVHPSRETFRHGEYYFWVEQVRNYWIEILNLDENDPDRQDLLEEFRNSYESLQSTVSKLPSFEELPASLLRAIRKTQLHEVNSAGGRTPSIPWHNTYAHILVGGQAMDRGFTIEGLTVTYMPRGPGMGNADTIQQRARFFGYKQTYFGYCRVFLENNVSGAYSDYIIHEEDVRDRLIVHDKTGKSLDAWKRAFFLDRNLKPTRHNVLDIDYTQGNLSSRWYEPKAPHDSEGAIKENRSIVQKFLNTLSFQTDAQRTSRIEVWHDVSTDVHLKDVYEHLLVPLRVTRLVDSQKFTGIRLQIAAYLDTHPDASCTIYYMSRGNPRKRTLNNNDEIPTLFQGPSPHTGTIYPGDRKIKAPKGVTVQIHILELIRENGENFSGVPTVAIWLPKDVSTDWLVQNQGRDEIGS